MAYFGTVPIYEGLENRLHRPQLDLEIVKEGSGFVVPQQTEKLDVKINLKHFVLMFQQRVKGPLLCEMFSWH